MHKHIMIDVENFASEFHINGPSMKPIAISFAIYAREKAFLFPYVRM